MYVYTSINQRPLQATDVSVASHTDNSAGRLLLYAADDAAQLMPL